MMMMMMASVAEVIIFKCRVLCVLVALGLAHPSAFRGPLAARNQMLISARSGERDQGRCWPGSRFNLHAMRLRYRSGELNSNRGKTVLRWAGRKEVDLREYYSDEGFREEESW
jgi:hypothetical protein